MKIKIKIKIKLTLRTPVELNARGQSIKTSLKLKRQRKNPADLCVKLYDALLVSAPREPRFLRGKNIPGSSLEGCVSELFI